MDEPGERLQAFCSITFDDAFVVRDLKIIEGTTGPFVAMPSRKLTAHCPQCGCKNHLRASHCNQCGGRLKEAASAKDEEGRAKLYADIAHPINSLCREMIQQRVIRAFEEEKARAKLPGYVPSYDDFEPEAVGSAAPSRTPPPAAPARMAAGRPARMAAGRPSSNGSAARSSHGGPAAADPAGREAARPAQGPRASAGAPTGGPSQRFWRGHLRLNVALVCYNDGYTPAGCRNRPSSSRTVSARCCRSVRTLALRV